MSETTLHSRAYTARASDDSESDLSWFRASTADIDRHGTIVEPRGIDTENFSANPVFMWGHDAYGGNNPPELKNVLGKVTEYRKSDEAFDIGVEWADHERAVMARDLVRSGFLSAVSVGFIPDAESISTRSIDGADIPVYERTELVEVSLVPVPSNPHAVALMRSMRLPIFSNPSPHSCADSDGLREQTRNLLAVERIRRDLRSGS